ncbi:MAG: FecR family protein [Acidobacteriia bacterium]|nr:FecR family protein [Terriglobia bacterium]
MRHLLLALLLTTTCFADTRAGSVSALLPAARIERAGAVMDASRGAEVQLNDLLRTDDQGRVRIKLLDQSVLSIGVKSQLRIVSHDAASRQTSLELNYGKLRAQVSKITRAGGKFELRTPTAIAGVIGTDFGVDATDPNLTKFICISGNVQLSSVDPNIPGTITCRGGTTVTVRRGHPPDQPERATRDQMENWKTITEPDQPEPQTPYKNY